jgi:WD40 repeat protein
MPSGAEQAVLRGHENTVSALAVSPDGQWLASGSWDRTIRLWALPSGIERAVLLGHQGVVQALAVSPDGQWLASGGTDQTIRLWELWDMSQMLQVPLGHMGQTDYERAQRLTEESSLSPEQRAVARYVAAVVGYRLGESIQSATEGITTE